MCLGFPKQCTVGYSLTCLIGIGTNHYRLLGWLTNFVYILLTTCIPSYINIFLHSKHKFFHMTLGKLQLRAISNIRQITQKISNIWMKTFYVMIFHYYPYFWTSFPILSYNPNISSSNKYIFLSQKNLITEILSIIYHADQFWSLHSWHFTQPI